MKLKHLFSILLVAFLGISATAQRNYEEFNVTDNLINADTNTVDYKWQFRNTYDYSVTIVADSLNGATNAGTIVFQVSNTVSGTKTWVNVHTLTIDGTDTQTALWEGTIKARHFRILSIRPTGGTTALFIQGVLKRQQVGYGY